jgi:hypothetical protein
MFLSLRKNDIRLMLHSILALGWPVAGNFQAAAHCWFSVGIVAMFDMYRDHVTVFLMAILLSPLASALHSMLGGRLQCCTKVVMVQ